VGSVKSRVVKPLAVVFSVAVCEYNICRRTGTDRQRRVSGGATLRAFKNKPNIYDFAPEPRDDHFEIDILEPSPGRRDASVTDTGGGDF